MGAVQVNELDELMCQELHMKGKPAHPAYGMGTPSLPALAGPSSHPSMTGLLTSDGLSAGWFKMRCDPARTSYRNWHTLTLEGEEGEPLGFCLFSRESMAAAGKGRKRRRTSYMVRRHGVGRAGQGRGIQPVRCCHVGHRGDNG